MMQRSVNKSSLSGIERFLDFCSLTLARYAIVIHGWSILRQYDRRLGLVTYEDTSLPFMVNL